MEPTTVSSTVEPTSPTTPPTSHSTNVGEPKSGLNIPIAALAGIGVGVFVAVLLVALLVIWKVKISKREPFSRGGNFTDGVMPYSDETSDPTNNMLHSEDRGAVQGVYPSPYASSPYRMDGGAGEEFGCGDSCVCDNDLRIHKVDFSKLDLIDLNHADLGSVAPSGITV
ncbi:uncharacterized protein LOC110986437 isoform X2 [Acanthaster planci]|uniref:Uncharacterized protein LOC110986437 isoform X2 n=1 Tax=Acanthaster planci TaxID=133434 RepID=A0A8B7ZGJ2_ACAPL|nr:uncharacterized protein LOC110986437 isoform X2 [Acanthaster planci]